MTKFADQLFDDLMREHGSTLAQARPPAAPKRHVTARRTLLAAGAAAPWPRPSPATLAAGGGAPAYAVTKNPDGTVTLAVYKTSGIAGANARLRQLGEGQVVIVPVEPGCPTSARCRRPPSSQDFTIMQSSNSRHGGSVILNVQGIPAGDILVLGAETTTNGPQVSALTGSALTSPPAPACMSLPPAPPPPPSGGSGPGPRPTSSRP